MANITDQTENTALNCLNMTDPKQKEEKITWEDGDLKIF